MKLTWGIAAACVVAMPAFAASPFDGTWKADIASAKLSTKPIHILLKDGVYTCDCSVPATTVKADGAFHPSPGHHYVDEEAVKVDDASTITMTSKLKGKIVYKTVTTISPDGQTMTNDWTDMSAPNGKVMTGLDTSKRAGPMPAGAHAVSGAWVASKVNTESEAALVAMVKLDGKKFSFMTPAGFGYEAMVGGPPVPFKGDPSKLMVQVTMPQPNTVVEIDMRDGKPVSKAVMVLAADNRKITVTSTDLLRNATTVYVVNKQ